MSVNFSNRVIINKKKNFRLSPLNLKVFSHQKLTLDEILLTIKQLHYTYTWETYHKWEVVVVAFCLYNVFAVARS